jgi:hypothetical protein
MISMDDERKAVAKAQSVLSGLAPTSPRNDEIAFALRYAARLVTAGMAQGFSSDAALNDLRSDAGECPGVQRAGYGVELQAIQRQHAGHC